MSSPFNLILRAAMGQCSTLPSERSTTTPTNATNVTYNRGNPSGNNTSKNGLGNPSGGKVSSSRAPMGSIMKTTSKKQTKYGKKINDYQKMDSDDSKNTTLFQDGDNKHGESRKDYSKEGKYANQENQYQASNMSRSGHGGVRDPSASFSSHSRRKASSTVVVENSAVSSPSPMQVKDPPPALEPPENSVKMRCYRLNLDSHIDLHGLRNGQPVHHMSHRSGPLEPRNNGVINMCISEDSSAAGSLAGGNNHFSTAQIFRGLTISRDGTVHSSKKGYSSTRKDSGGRRGNEKKGKADEKSRQAVKIDKAKDLVEESLKNVTKGMDDEPSKMVSLYIMGEYDDMKHLVKDGSKRLKESENLSDELILSNNQKRTPVVSTIHKSSPSLHNKAIMSPNGLINSPPGHQTKVATIPEVTSQKKRSPQYEGVSAGYSPARSRQKSPTPDDVVMSPGEHYADDSHRKNNSRSLPRLKENPRDTRPMSTRGNQSVNLNVRVNSQGTPRHASDKSGCNKLPIFGGGDSDWSDTLGLSRGFNTFWNCGVTGGDRGTISPTNNNNCHPSNHYNSGGRNSSSNSHHSGSNRQHYFPNNGVAERRDETSMRGGGMVQG